MRIYLPTLGVWQTVRVLTWCCIVTGGIRVAGGYLHINCYRFVTRSLALGDQVKECFLKLDLEFLFFSFCSDLLLHCALNVSLSDRALRNHLFFITPLLGGAGGDRYEAWKLYDITFGRVHKYMYYGGKSVSRWRCWRYWRWCCWPVPPQYIWLSMRGMCDKDNS